jgi:hypothetical protein
VPAFTGDGRGVALASGFTLRAAIIGPLRNCATAKLVVALVITPVVNQVIFHNFILPKSIGITSTTFILNG